MYILLHIFLVFFLCQLPMKVFSDNIEFDNDHNFEKIFEYQDDLNWNIDISELWSWFDSMNDSEEHINCGLETKYHINIEDNLSMHGKLG